MAAVAHTHEKYQRLIDTCKALPPTTVAVGGATAGG